MKLKQLLQDLNNYELDGELETEVKGISYDSRQIQPGYLFVAIKGYNQDGY